MRQRPFAASCLRAFLSVVVVLLVVGCAAPRGPAVTEHPDAPAYVEIAAAHNDRIDGLAQVYSRGSIELRWRDDRGRHFEQGEIDLYLDLPHHTALRVEKLGRTYLWIGSDDERFWFFDLTGDERVLHTGRHETTLIEAAGLAVQPLAMLDLMGLTALPEPGDLSGQHHPAVAFDGSRDAWVVEAPGVGGPMRVFFDRSRLLPLRVEHLSPGGEVLYESRIAMNRYRGAALRGVAPLHFPRMPTLVDITAVGDHAADGTLKLALDSPTGIVDDQPFDRVFDLDRLISAHRPARIEGEPE